mgnify:CR=1 FL=1
MNTEPCGVLRLKGQRELCTGGARNRSVERVGHEATDVALARSLGPFERCAQATQDRRLENVGSNLPALEKSEGCVLVEQALVQCERQR